MRIFEKGQHKITVEALEGEKEPDINWVKIQFRRRVGENVEERLISFDSVALKEHKSILTVCFIILDMLQQNYPEMSGREHMDLLGECVEELYSIREKLEDNK